MRAGAVPSGTPTGGELAWRARICRATSQEVAGAGIVFGTRHLLTCAHVVAKAGGPDGDIVVDLVAWSPALRTTARVIEGCWCPETEDGTADVALLELADPMPSEGGARLRRRTFEPGKREPVSVFGFPADLDFAQYLPATIAGPTGPGDEWMQLDTAPHQPIVPGFSGGAVRDEASEAIVGMVVARSTDTSKGLAWMIRVETILKYLPVLDQWAVGIPAVSRSLREPSPVRPSDDRPAREITRFFTDESPQGSVHVITTGDPDSPTSVAVRYVVTLADRQQRVASPDQVRQLVREGTVPPAGSIDLALNVTGLTVEQVVEDILDRLGRDVQQPLRAWRELLADPPRMRLVVVGIDRAADPDGLVETVLAPLARVARERGLRILLGFTRQSVSSQSLERMPQQLRVDRLAGALDRLAAKVDQARRRRSAVAGRFTEAPPVPDGIASLREQLTAIRTALPAGELSQLTTMVDACEAAIDAASGELSKVRRELDGLAERHRALKARLVLYRDLAGDRNGRLGELHREAGELLDHTPCDLAAAAAAVERYGHAVHDRRGVPGAGEPA